MKGLTPAAANAVKELHKISHSVSYEEAIMLRSVIQFIKVRDAELRLYNEERLKKIIAKDEYEMDCG